MGVQYFRLVKRLKAYYKTERGRAKWSSISGFMVRPVIFCGGVLSEILLKKLKLFCKHFPTAKLVCSLVFAFLVNSEAPAFYIRAALAHRLGFSSASRGGRLAAAKFQGREGSLCCIKLSGSQPKPFEGKVVRVVKVVRHVNESAVSASLDLDPFFNQPRDEDAFTFQSVFNIFCCVGMTPRVNRN